MGKDTLTIRHSIRIPNAGPDPGGTPRPPHHLSSRRHPNPAQVIFCVQAVVSPLLSNIYLDSLDHLMAEKGIEMVRYADDFVVLGRTEVAAQEALAVVRG